MIVKLHLRNITIKPDLIVVLNKQIYFTLFLVIKIKKQLSYLAQRTLRIQGNLLEHFRQANQIIVNIRSNNIIFALFLTLCVYLFFTMGKPIL